MDDDFDVGYKCPNGGKLMNNGFKDNKADALAEVVEKSGQLPINYWITSEVNSHSIPDAAFAAGQCRVDVTQFECMNCLKNVQYDFMYRKYCHDTRIGIVWRNHCMIKYSYLKFVGQLDTQNVIYSSARDPLYSNKSAVIKLLNALFFDVYTETNWVRNYDWAIVPWNKDQYLYGMIQCNKDLDYEKCVSCLSNLKTLLFHIAMASSVGRADCGSCAMKFNTTNFISN